MDSLTDREARLFLALGNDHMNHIWEKGYSIKLHPKRPDPDSDRTIRDKWIRCKYIEKQFLENCQSKLSKEKNNQNLYESAIVGNVLTMASCIAHGGNVNWKNHNENGKTVLQVCLQSLQDGREGNFFECVELLIQNGADIN